MQSSRLKLYALVFFIAVACGAILYKGYTIIRDRKGPEAISNKEGPQESKKERPKQNQDKTSNDQKGGPDTKSNFYQVEGVKDNSGYVSLEDQLKLRDKFLSDNRIRMFSHPFHRYRLVQMGKGATRLIIVPENGMYRIELINIGQIETEKFFDFLSKTLNIYEDDFKKLEIEHPDKRFEIELAVETTKATSNFLFVVIRHPYTQRKLAMIFEAREFNRKTENFTNEFFWSITPY